MSVDKWRRLHFTLEWVKSVIMVRRAHRLPLAVSCQSCNASRTRRSEQVDDKAAYKFSANCGRAVNRVWNEDSDASLAEEVKAVPGPSQSVLNGLHQCVIAITRSLQRPQQDELYFMALQRIFFFLPCFSQPVWIYIFSFSPPSTWQSRFWMRNCFLPLNHLTIIPSTTFPEGDIFCLSQSEVAGCATMYLYEFSCFCKWYFRLSLACFVRRTKLNLPPFCSLHNKPRPLMCTKLKKSVFILLYTQPPEFMVYHCIRAAYKVKQISDVMYVHCTYFMSGRSLIRDDSVAIRQERPSITEHRQIWRGPFTSKHADCEEYEVVLLRTSPNQRGSNQSSNIPQLFTNAPQITTRVVTNLDP